jgi:hypothetical protein
MGNKAQDEVIDDLRRRKAVSREYPRSLPPIEKIAMLFNLQEQYCQMLIAREKNGGQPVPEKWRKWNKARSEPKLTEINT